jgi:DNA processing protein
MIKMNIHDYILGKISKKNYRITDPLLDRLGTSESILMSSVDDLAVILSKTKLQENTMADFLMKVGDFAKNKKKIIGECNLEIADIRKELGVDIVSFSDDHYPQQLKRIPGKPLNLYFKGDLGFDFDKSISIVGTRKISKDAIGRVNSIGNYLSQKKYTIISGLAIGTDSAAHRAALNMGTKTIAVLPYISKRIYPSENINLAEEILKSGGCIISENINPERKNFKIFLTERNRLISGLSKGVFIVEGSRQSGSYSQYNHAKRQKKIIFTIIPRYFDDENAYLPRLIYSENGFQINNGQEIIDILSNKRINKKELDYFI